VVTSTLPFVMSPAEEVGLPAEVEPAAVVEGWEVAAWVAGEGNERDSLLPLGRPGNYFRPRLSGRKYYRPPTTPWWFPPPGEEGPGPSAQPRLGVERADPRSTTPSRCRPKDRQSLLEKPKQHPFLPPHHRIFTLFRGLVAIIS
jgi:hypothetical protein